MEFFGKTKVVKLRSHMNKYLVADEDGEKVHQSRSGSGRRAAWTVEPVKNNHRVRFKSCHGKYLTATETPFLLGMTGKMVKQTEGGVDGKEEWEPIRDGFEVKLRSWCGKFLRGNGGTPPWRNTVTHDEPHSSATRDWVLWEVEAVEEDENSIVDEFPESVLSSFANSDDLSVAGSDEPSSPMSVFSLTSPTPVRNFQVSLPLFFPLLFPCSRSFTQNLLSISFYLDFLLH